MLTRHTAIALKEIRVLLRSRRAFWLLLLGLAVIGGGFALAWLDSNVAGAYSRVRFSREMFMTLSVILICTMGLITPILTAVAVSGEREHKTLDLLYCTAVPRLSLLLGKWLAAISFQLLLVFLLLPILSLVFQLGGVGLNEYLLGAAVAALTVATYGMLGLAVSVHARRSIRAMMATLAIVLFLNPGILVMIVALVEFRFIHDPVGLRIISAFCPPFAFAYIADSASSGSGSMPGAGEMIAYHLVFQLTLFILCGRIAWRGLARGESLKPVIAKKPIDDPALLARRRRRFPYYLIDPLRRAQVIADRQNPFFVKEHRYGAVCRPQSTIRLGYVGLLVSVPLLAIVFQSYSSLSVIGYLSIWAISVTALNAPILGSIGITGEREENTLDLLLSTPDATHRIVRAKFLAVLRTLAFLAAATMLIPVVAQFMDAREPQATAVALAKFVPLILAFLALYAALGVYISAICRRNLTAIATTYSLMILLYFLPILLLTFEHNYHVFFGDFLLNPVFHGLQKVYPMISPIYSLEPYLGGDPLANLGRHDESWGVILIRAAVVGLLAWSLLRLANRRLNRTQ